MAADAQKIEAVCSYPTPTDLKHLRSFLGLASYYRRFIANFVKKANYLHALTHKDTPILWDSNCQQAIESLKQCLIAAPVLAFPNIDDPFLMEMDASGIDLGAVLALKQEDGSVLLLAYASRSLQKNERNYGVTELEALAVLCGVKHFCPYLHGHSEVRACYSAELLVPRRTVTAQTRIIVILPCSICTPARAS